MLPPPLSPLRPGESRRGLPVADLSTVLASHLASEAKRAFEVQDAVAFRHALDALVDLACARARRSWARATRS